jgi:iron-sulfur cluster assembly protein
MIHLSHSAVEEILRLKLRQQNSQVFFRLGIQPVGCAGLSYLTKFDERVQTGDQIYDCNGIQVAIDANSLPHLQGLTLDYSEDLMGGSFRFHNPNAVKSCDCGNSFSIAEA